MNERTYLSYFYDCNDSICFDMYCINNSLLELVSVVDVNTNNHDK
jgi:hypothetical protein